MRKCLISCYQNSCKTAHIWNTCIQGLKPFTVKSSVGHRHHQQLLNQLPRLLRAYGVTYAEKRIDAVVIVLCDLDDKCL